MSETKFVILATEGLTTQLLYEELSKHGLVKSVILEMPESSVRKIKRRFKRLPFLNVIGQLAFLFFLMPCLGRSKRKRIQQIVIDAGYSNHPIAPEKIVRISSVNDDHLIELIKKEQPDFVFVNGTRIIQKKILQQIGIPVINIHVGITPTYRGIHGGYWALYNNDLQNFGVTLHHVDAGVDTGKIIAQKKCVPDEVDNFASYPVLQFVEGLKLVADFIADSNDQKVPIHLAEGTESEQYYHPGFFQYLLKRWIKGVR